MVEIFQPNDGLAIGDTIIGATLGSVFFAGVAGILAQDNTNFFWDDTNNRLGIGTASPGVPLDVVGAIRGSTSLTATAGNVNLTGGYNVNWGAGIAFIEADATYMRFGAISGAEQFRIANGYFSIGTIENLGRFGVVGTGATSATFTARFQNSALTELLAIRDDGNVGIGTTSPTAVLHLKAGTATANTAPLKFNTGTLLPVAEAGVMEFLTDIHYLTNTTGAIRRNIVVNKTGRATAQTNVAATSVVTYTPSASDASFEISANVLVTASVNHTNVDEVKTLLLEADKLGL